VKNSEPIYVSGRNANLHSWEELKGAFKQIPIYKCYWRTRHKYLPVSEWLRKMYNHTMGYYWVIKMN
jgi:hypothetical protein